jgi:hypothetical protein
MLRRRPVMRTMARTAVVAGTATVVSGNVARRQQARAQTAAEAQAYEAQQAQAAAAPPPPPPPAAPAPAGMSAVEQLTALASLKEQGVLTDDEFAAEKAKILAT